MTNSSTKSLKQEDCKFKISLDYIMRPCLKTAKQE
jgi:hypothetical protein